jgi:hypothetical protein
VIRPEDIPEEDFGLRTEAEDTVERLFDSAIENARATKEWPAVVHRPKCAVDRNALVAVAHRYRSAKWRVTLDLPNGQVLATIKRA